VRTFLRDAATHIPGADDADVLDLYGHIALTTY
jgi:hypothetical protein